ncbi:hypothetical protein ACTA71_003774 [Dictyostelium dimigraforme]
MELSWSSDSLNLTATFQSSGDACSLPSVSGNIFQENVCFSYSGENPSICTFDGENIVQTFYNKTDYDCQDKSIMLICGILDFFFFGVGTIILGMLDSCNLFVIVFGILQLCIPFVGWIVSIIYGVLIILKALKQ